ncbi:MAG: surface-adhesin E family protein [Gemmatimonadales bacterium]
MKFSFLVAAAVFSAATSTNAAAQSTWPTVFKDATMAVAVDSANAVRNDDGSYMTRSRWDYKKLHALESRRPYMAMTQTAMLRCTPVRIKRLTESFYSANGSVVREGSAPNPRDIQYMTWDRIRTGTDGSKAYNAMCAMLTRRDRGKR